jgi:hypothetical protein
MLTVRAPSDRGNLRRPAVHSPTISRTCATARRLLNLVTMRFAYFALAIATLPACTIVWGDGDDDVICPGAVGDQNGLAAPIPGQVNPFTLECQFFGGGGGCSGEDRAEPPTWGYCESQCTGLSESACVNTSGCRTAYDHNCLLTDGPCPALTPYIGCFAVDMTGPVQGACEGLDGFECSRHDDCLSTYSSATPRQFQLCMPELIVECGDCG